MPNQTFFSLDGEKRQRILDAALLEFSGNIFSKVTVDNIVNRAGIPKGSFYQYFTNKEDLYKHLFSFITEQKKDSLNSFLIKMEEMKFSSFMRAFYLHGARFDLQDPKQLDLQDKFMRNCRKELRDEILDLMIEDSNRLFNDVLIFYRDRGELNPVLNIDMTAEILTTLSVFLGKRLVAASHTSLDQIAGAVDDMLNVILKGIVKEK